VAAIPITIQQREISRLRGQVAAGQGGGAQAAGTQGAKVGNTDAALHRLSQAEIESKIQAIIKDPNNRNAAWAAFIKSLDPADFSKVAVYLDKQALTIQMRQRFLDDLVSAWAKSNPQAAMDYLLTYGYTARSTFMGMVLKIWEEKDPEAAAACWTQLPLGQARNWAAKDVLTTLANTNPAEAFHLMQGVDPSTQRDLMLTVFTQWGASDPAAAIAQLAAMPAGDNRRTAFQAVAIGWAGQDPQAALAWANTLPSGPERDTAIGSAIDALGETDLNQAMDYINRLPASTERSSGISFLAESLGFNNHEAAAAFVQQLPEGKDKQQAERGIAITWAGSDPAGATAFAEGLPVTTPDTESIFNYIGNIWTGYGSGFQDALAAAANMTEGPNRDAFLGGVFNGTVKNSPMDAEKLISSLPADQQTAAANQVTVALASTDPSTAAAWMASLPDGITSTKTINTVVSDWALSDPTAAGQWIQTLPAGASQDSAMQSYVGAIAYSSPASAAAWAVNIGDPTKRNAAIEKVAQSWLQADPTAAAAWIEKTDLPDAQKQKLLAAPGASGNAGK